MKDLEGQTTIMLCFQEREMYGFPYRHYFLRTGPTEFIIEFHGTDHFEASFEIHNKSMRGKYFLETLADGSNKTNITPEILTRLQLVEGISNYSLILRNCEHVTKFVLYGKWFSSQVAADMPGIFSRYIRAEVHKFLNTPPRGIYQSSPIAELRVDLKDKWEFKAAYSEARHTYENRSDSYNVLLIGPTGMPIMCTSIHMIGVSLRSIHTRNDFKDSYLVGSGKSNLINHIFRQNIAVSRMQATGVTQSIDFYPGTYLGPNSKGNVCIIDTVGFCDKVMPLKELLQVVEGAIRNQEVPIHRLAQ